MERLTQPGQIKRGATVELFFKGEGQSHTVDQILMPGSDKEEILLDTESNLYFITSMAIDGSSWAKQVKFANP